MSQRVRANTLDLLYELQRDLERKIQPIQKELERIEYQADCFDQFELDLLVGGLLTQPRIAADHDHH